MDKTIDLLAAGLGFGAVATLLFIWGMTALSDNVSILRINDYGEAIPEIIVLVVMLVITWIHFKNTISEYLNGKNRV